MKKLEDIKFNFNQKGSLRILESFAKEMLRPSTYLNK
jgi:hypothetical protein